MCNYDCILDLKQTNNCKGYDGNYGDNQGNFMLVCIHFTISMLNSLSMIIIVWSYKGMQLFLRNICWIFRGEVYYDVFNLFSPNKGSVEREKQTEWRG